MALAYSLRYRLLVSQKKQFEERKDEIMKVTKTQAIHNEQGIVLIATLGLLSIIALMGTLAVTNTFTEIKISSNHKTSKQSFYIAEAGIHRAIGMLNTSTDWIGSLANPTISAFPGDNSLGDGTYVVKVFENDPTPGSVRINSTGNVSGSSSIVEAIVTPEYYDILDYATFDCGNLDLKSGVTNKISGGDVFVGGNLELKSTGTHLIQNGDVYATGKIKIEGNSSITGGNAFANGDIDVKSSASPNIGGNATAGGNVSGSGTISGTTTQGIPAPVINQCVGTNLADIIITSDIIQGFRDNATTTISGDYEFDDDDNYTGIVHITGDFELEENATFSGNVIFIVDGNVDITGSLTSSPPGSSVTFLVPNGNFKVKGGGSFTIDGTLLVGTVDQDGSNITGGNIDVKDGSDLTVNGSVIAVNGNTDASSGGSFTVNYQAPSDSNLMKPNSYTMALWREIRN
jgi:hypothetical protein